MTNKICDGCETVAHCMKNGCVPKTTKQTQVRSTEEAPARSALKLALEALNSFPTKHLTPFISSARTAIREALASEASEESSGTEQPDRHELQKDGKHPAPCARFCEATAFNIEIRGLRKRLAEQPAQPQQEPVECANGCRGFVKHSTPAQRKPLTDEEIKQLADKHLDVGDGSHGTHYVFGETEFARAIEAAHGIVSTEYEGELK